MSRHSLLTHGHTEIPFPNCWMLERPNTNPVQAYRILSHKTEWVAIKGNSVSGGMDTSCFIRTTEGQFEGEW